MKHLLDIGNFLTEALSLEFQKKYKPFFEKRPKEVIDRLNKLLDNKERVYIPYNSDTISETQLNVKIYLEETGYKILDYKLNQAVQVENNKRVIRISKLLAKNPELLKDFTLDDTRANTRAGSDFSIVLTSNYEDVAGMSFDRCWTNSCLDIQSGQNKKYVKNEVQQGTVVAYLIKSDDLNVEEPLGRVNIKPYYNFKEENEIIYVLDHRVYGNVPDEKLFKSIISSYLKEKQEIKIGGFFRKEGGLYSDEGSPREVCINKDYSLCYGDDCLDEEGYNKAGFDKKGYNREGYNKKGYDKEGYNKQGFDKYGFDKTKSRRHKEYLTDRQYKSLKNWVTGTFDVDENGLVNVTGDVFFSYHSLPKNLPISFGIVTGNFDCSHNNLTSLVGAPKEVGGSFNCVYNRFVSLRGAPLKVGGDFRCSNNLLTSLNGAPTEVGGSFSCSSNNIYTLLGAPQKVKNFNCSNNLLSFLHGAPKEVTNDFYCGGQGRGVKFTEEDVREVSSVGGSIFNN
jgi:hypothetical protein